jgi:phage/plasmid-associated DNA primase
MADLRKSGYQTRPLSKRELQSLVKQYGKPYYFNKYGEVSSINQAFWAALHQAEHIQLFEPDERTFYRYNQENGLYSIVSEDVIKQEIASRILEVSRQQGLPSLERKRTNYNLNHIVSQLKGISEKKNAFRRSNKFVHLANGVIVFKSNGEADFCSFSPEFYSRNQCPIPYNASATCERFLNELLYLAVTPEDALLLQKFAGLCLLGDNLIQKLLILDGLPGRGKSTLALIIEDLVGRANVTELRTRHLSERFELFRYLKKSLLVGVDVPGQFLSEKGAHVIKGLVGCDWFDAEQKGGTASFPFQGNFCILITSNSRLQVRLDGDDGAWKRRLLIIRFEAPAPPKKIPNFNAVLIREEGSGILNWALEGLAMLLSDIETHGDIQLTGAQEKTVNGLLAESDSLRHFLMDNVVPDGNADISTAEIVEAYAEYCPLKGWNPKLITIIYRELESLMLELFGTSISHSISRDGRNTRGFRRVAFKKVDKG